MATYRTIRIDEFGNSPLDLPRRQVGFYGEHLQHGQRAQLWDAETGLAIPVAIVEVYTRIHTHGSGGRNYVCAEVEILSATEGR